MGEFSGAYTLLYVRTEAKLKKRIDRTVLIPDTEIESRAAEALPDATAVIFVHCRSGQRSEAAAKKLDEMCYNHVYDLATWTIGPMLR